MEISDLLQKFEIGSFWWGASMISFKGLLVKHKRGEMYAKPPINLDEWILHADLSDLLEILHIS